MILLAFLGIAVVGAAALFASGRFGARRRAGADAYRAVPADVLGEPDPRLPPVLLPESPGAADIEDLRFSVALRGYRMDEVDEVLQRLAAALLERDAALAQLREPEGRPQPGTGRHAQVQSPEDETGRQER
ncbi:DivIVA domain-containing protein [Arthrobacter sp. 3Tela_A]|uniref:DivIVA domain-containing protein n=1 Tax=Arthrobacter sp. 3Tela_A TaxID=3093743 RepID=UPI003BB5B69D